MALRPIERMIRRAREGGYAIGYFESWNAESLQGVIDAAEQTRSPIIVGFNGEFLSSGERLLEERLEVWARLGLAAAASADVPCGLIFNECSRDDWVERAAESGFNLVMLADPSATYADYRDRVARIVQHAHAHGSAVEAELGVLPSGASGRVETTGAHTDPDLAARFLAETGADLLAVSVGNVHVLMNGRQDLDLERLAAIRRRVDAPLVLHGGTGITEASLRAAIGLGVAKVNYGTYLKQRTLAALRTRLCAPEATAQPDPHRLLGRGGAEDLLTATRIAVRDAVLERIEALGCCGRADA